MRESRLFKIIYHLINNGQATAEELAEMLEVSVRTIYRDVDALSSVGVPVYAVNGRKGGIKLFDGFVLSSAAFSEQEKTEILTGLCSLSAAQYPRANEILSKLSALFQMNAADWIDVDLTRWGGEARQEQELFVLLRKAIFHKIRIEFEYFNSRGEVSKRTAEPGRLVYRDKAWYLYGFCLLRNDWRLFRLTRMKNAVLTDCHFERSCEAVQWPKAGNFGPSVRLRLTCRGSEAHRLYDIFEEGSIHRNDRGGGNDSGGNGTISVSATLPETEWLYGFLLSLGDSLLAVEPKDIKDELMNRHDAALKQLRIKEAEYEY